LYRWTTAVHSKTKYSGKQSFLGLLNANY